MEDFQDESLAPLKRNHACLACKKRKVKCDGTRPNCAPCLRSHAHAVRAANRAGVRHPVLSCEWADVDSPSASPEADAPEAVRQISSGSIPKKKVSGKKPSLDKEKSRRQEDEKETLLAKIAELEARLAGMTPPSDTTRSANSSSNTDTSPNNIQPTLLTPELDWDFSNFFLVPTNWPKNLPAPYLLDHLVDTFFNLVPSASRMIHRAKLLARLKLPPTHEQFPHPALLHAICAIAAQHTAWVTSLPVDALDTAVKIKQLTGGDFEQFEDFALAQAESTRRAIHQTHQICQVGSPDSIFEILQAEVLVSDVWYCRGLYLKGWTEGGQAVRFVKGLELTNRNFPKRYKSGILPAPANAVSREERLATTWKVFYTEAVSGISRYWPISLDDREMFCKLPAGAADFQRKEGDIPENPQDARDPRLYIDHPVRDAFVMNCKVAMLCSRVARFVRDWAQREVRPGDVMLGMQLQIFKDILRDITDLQRTMPEELKSVFKQGFVTDAELLALHIVPNVALLILFEPFVNWDEPHSTIPMLKAYEAIMAVIHLIPSNLDVSLLLTADIAFNIYTCGRMIADFIQYALERQAYGLAVQYRAELAAVQSLLGRFGQKHPLGLFSVHFLENYLDDNMNGREHETCPGKRIEAAPLPVYDPTLIPEVKASEPVDFLGTSMSFENTTFNVDTTMQTGFSAAVEGFTDPLYNWSLFDN